MPQQKGLFTMVVDGVFAISLIALIALNSGGVSRFISAIGTGYVTAVSGLQGRQPQ